MARVEYKKNVIFFSVDMRRQDCYETYGGTNPSPNMTRLAERGVFFENMYSASSSTTMSLSAMINGRSCHDFDRNTYPEENPPYFEDNIFSMMKKSGRTNYIVLQDLFKKYYNWGIYTGEDAQLHEIPDYCPTTVGAEQIVNLSKQIQEPYCIFAHLAVSEPEMTDSNPDNPHRLERFLKSDDDAIGILIDNLDFEITTLVFYSDHGFLKGERNLIMHAFFLCEGVVRVPFIVSSDQPGVVSGKHSLTQVKDLLEGVDIQTPKFIYSDTQYKGQPHRITMVMQEDWEYVASYSQATAFFGAVEELYNVKDDPQEFRNLLNDFSRHPLRPDWNQQDLTQFKGTYVFDYESSFIQSKIEILQNDLCRIWVKNLYDLLEHLKGKGNDVDKFLNTKQSLLEQTPKIQIDYVRKVMAEVSQSNNYVTQLRKSDFLATKDN